MYLTKEEIELIISALYEIWRGESEIKSLIEKLEEGKNQYDV